jgi:hypothetical protein
MIHVDAILTNLSRQYKNEAMIWPQVLPMIKVAKRSDLYFRYKKEDAYRLGDDKIGATGLPNEMDWAVDTDNYSVVDHAFGDWLSQAAIENADNPLQPEADTNNFLNLLLDIAQESRVANTVFNAANYSDNNQKTLSGGAQWDAVNGDSDPIGDIMTAIESCFMRADTLVFSVSTWAQLRRNPKILDAVKSSTRLQAAEGGIASQSEVATLFEVERVLVGRARYITSKEGQTATFARLWGPHAAALYVDPNPGIKSITYGAVFSEMLRQTQRDFDPKRGVKGSHYFKVAWNSTEKVIANDCGYFIQNAVNTVLG